MHATDTLIQEYFNTNRTESLTNFFYALTMLFDLSPSFLLVSFCLALLIYLVKGLRYSILFVATIALTTVIVYLLKISFNISRPTSAFYDVYGQSFPSYHATIAAVFFVLLMYIFHGSFKSRVAMVFNVFSIIFIFLVAFSRVYLGVHWFTDVVVGVVLGLLISHGAVLVFKKYFKNL